MLCQRCLSIFDCNQVDGKKSFQRGSLVIRLRSIQRSGRGGCPLCAQLYRKLRRSLVAADEAHQDFLLTRYYLYYRIIESGSIPSSYNLVFRLSTERLPEETVIEGSARDLIICTHEFHVASLRSTSTPQ